MTNINYIKYVYLPQNISSTSSMHGNRFAFNNGSSMSCNFTKLAVDWNALQGATGTCDFSPLTGKAYIYIIDMFVWILRTKTDLISLKEIIISDHFLTT